MIYCLQIEKSFPDYKRPYATHIVQHCMTVEEANERRREEKKEYYEGYLDYLKESGEDVPEDIDDLDEDESQDYIFRESYMDMPPFTATLYEIKIEEDGIIKTRCPFPVKNLSSGESFESNE